MAKAYFSRQEPFYVLGQEDISDSAGFDAVEVEIDPIVLANVRSVRRLILMMEEMFVDHPAPEECAQEECDIFAAEVRRIFKTRAQSNVKQSNA